MDEDLINLLSHERKKRGSESDRIATLSKAKRERRLITKRLMSLLCVMGLIAAVTLSHSALADDPAAEAGVPFHGSLGVLHHGNIIYPSTEVQERL